MITIPLFESVYVLLYCIGHNIEGEVVSFLDVQENVGHGFPFQVAVPGHHKKIPSSAYNAVVQEGSCGCRYLLAHIFFTPS